LNISDFFVNPTAWGIGLAIAFGLIWLLPLGPKKLNRLSTWLIFFIGAAVFAPCIAWIQVPLQNLVSRLMQNTWGQDEVIAHVFLASVPVILLSGLVQEGAKMIPTSLYWLANQRRITLKTGLTMGAMAGAGFGILEAQWGHNLIFSSGWTIQTAQTAGFLGFAGFWERFFTVGLHISLGALTGWGLAKGWGWQIYLLAALFHSLFNYCAILFQYNKLTLIQIEIVMAIASVSLYVVIAWLRLRKSYYDEEEEDGTKIRLY
jgi:RsiW-degrading membrane proteinase PrsW (M82 family)